MKDFEPHLIRAAARAAKSFMASGACEELTRDELFAVRFGDDPETWFALVDAPPDVPPRLTLARGADGLSWTRSLAADAEPAGDVAARVEAFAVEFAGRGDLPRPMLDAFSKAGCAATTGNDLPIVQPWHRGEFTTQPDRTHLKRFAAAATAIASAAEAGELDADLWPEDGALPVVFGDAPASGPFTGAPESFPGPDGAADPPPVLGREWSGEVVGGVRWIVGVVEDVLDEETLAATGAEQQCALLIHDGQGDSPLAVLPLVRPQLRLAAALLLRGHPHAEETEGAIPGEIVFLDSALRDLVAPAFEKAGAKCVVVESDPAFDEAVQALRASPLDPLGDGEDGEDDVEDAVEAIRDPGVKRWARAVESARRLIAEAAAAARLPDNRSALVYYGSRNAEAEIHEDLFDLAEDMHLEWCATHHRPLHGGKSVLDLVLAKKPPADETAVLRALAAAPPTLIAVRGAGREEGSLDVTDLATGGAIALRYHDFSDTTAPGTCGAVRIFQAGPYTFGVVFSLLFRSGEIRGFLDALRAAGCDAEAGEIASKSHFLGRAALWISRRFAAEDRDEDAAGSEITTPFPDDPGIVARARGGRRAQLRGPAPAAPDEPSSSPSPSSSPAPNADAAQWLDLPQAALDGLSPRAFAATPGGRFTISAYLRAAPAPDSGPQWDTARAALLQGVGTD